MNLKDDDLVSAVALVVDTGEEPAEPAGEHHSATAAEEQSEADGGE